MGFLDKIKHAWSAFNGNDSPPPNEPTVHDYGRRTSWRPVYRNSKDSFAATIFNRIALDAAMTQINHVVINKKNDDAITQDSGLNYCLTIEANEDQTSVAFIQDLVFSLLEEGKVAVVPVETTLNAKVTGAYDINSMRVGQILGFTSKSVQVKVYDERKGIYKDIWLPKKMVAIIQNPLYDVINRPNSTLQRLLRKMNQDDILDQYYMNNRLDIILQMPQALRTDAQIESAKKRIQNIEEQLSSGSNGVAYIDATEKITQLNRPANSQLVESINLLKKDFYNQLGLTEDIFNGTASEAQLRNYFNRTIDPILVFIIKELERKFLTKTARTQGHAIEYYRNTLKFVSAEQIVSLGDTFRRNEIVTSNEIRKLIGFKRSNEKSADILTNPNIAAKNQETAGSAAGVGSMPRDPVDKTKSVKMDTKTGKEGGN